MKRADILAAYETRGAVIVSPGQFEGEMVYVPYFWDAYLNGMADEDDGEYLTFNVAADDRAEFPELADVSRVVLYQRDDGFVIGKAF